MKQVISILLVIALGVFIFMALYFADESPLQVYPLREADVSARVSQGYRG